MNLALACGCHTYTHGSSVPVLTMCATHAALLGLTDVLLVALAKNLANQGQAIYDIWMRRAEYQIVRSSSRNDALQSADWKLLAIVSPDMVGGGGEIRS